MKSLDELIKEADDIKTLLKRAIFQNIFLILCNAILLTTLFVFKNSNMPVVMKVLQFITLVLIIFNTLRWTKDLVDYIKYYIKVYVIKEMFENIDSDQSKNES